MQAFDRIRERNDEEDAPIPEHEGDYPDTYVPTDFDRRAPTSTIPQKRNQAAQFNTRRKGTRTVGPPVTLINTTLRQPKTGKGSRPGVVPPAPTTPTAPKLKSPTTRIGKKHAAANIAAKTPQERTSGAKPKNTFASR
jgi:hypothetical protein